MNHFILFLICILSVEVFFRLNFLSTLNTILDITKKVLYLITKDNISDHWKEKVIPIYAFKIMKSSIKILLILLLIFALFVISDTFLFKFHELALSFIGFAESLFFAYGYAFFRKAVTK